MSGSSSHSSISAAANHEFVLGTALMAASICRFGKVNIFYIIGPFTDNITNFNIIIQSPHLHKKSPPEEQLYFQALWNMHIFNLFPYGRDPSRCI